MGFQEREKAYRYMKNTRTPWTRAAQEVVLVICLLVFLLGSALPAFALVREPYLQLATPTSITIVWRTDDLLSPDDSRVQYGTNSGNLNLTAMGVSLIPGSNAAVKDRIVEITGLTPATQYFYNVGTATGGVVEGGGTTDHFFVTPPLVGTAVPFNVWLVGDSGFGTPGQIAVRQAIVNLSGALPLDIYLHAGDIAYNTGEDDEFTDYVFTIYQDILRQTPLWPTLGNHDNASNISLGTGPYFEAFVLPTAGQAGGVASGTEAYYSFDYANVHFVVLDSQESDRDPDPTVGLDPTGPMLTWLNDDLADTTQDWVIALWHHPPYSKGGHDSDELGDSGNRLIDMREKVLSILELHGVNLVLGGHSHLWERSNPLLGAYGYNEHTDCYIAGVTTPACTPNRQTLINDGKILDLGDGNPDVAGGGDGAYADGPVYVVAGHGGKDVPAVAADWPHPTSEFSERFQFGSGLLDIDGSRITGRNVRSDGQITDIFAIDRAPANVAPTVDAGPPQTIVLPAGATLDGTVTDDHLPNPPDLVTTTWTDVTNPPAGTVTFGDPAAVDTTATFSQVGTYTLRLTADDSLLVNNDDVIITVDPSGGANQAPTVAPLQNQAITLPNVATLDGTISDDGLPFMPGPGAVTAAWTKISGPGTVTFGDDTAVDTTASFSVYGTYVLRLTADDSMLTDFEQVTITVSPTPPFIAYNDLAWGTGQLTGNTTTITSPNGVSGLLSTGQLIDFATGNSTGVTLAVTGGNFLGAPQAMHGADPTPTTDAHTIFNGKVSGQGALSYINEDGSSLILTFTGLAPNLLYDLAFFAHRDLYDWDRASLVTISGQDAFTNTSSTAMDNPLTLPGSGEIFSGPSDTSTRLPADNDNGYVARFSDINPGSDGEVVLTISFDGDVPSQYKGKYASAVRLQGFVPMCTVAPDPDLNNDTLVNIFDLSIVGSCFGKDPTAIAKCVVADTQCDGLVNIFDLSFVGSSFGQGGF